MNGVEFLSNLEQINRPIRSIKKIKKAILNLKEIDIIDIPIITDIEKEDLISKNKQITKAKHSYKLNHGIKPIHTLTFLSSLTIGLPILVLTGSLLISGFLTSTIFYSFFKMRKKWFKERIELLSERKEFKKEIEIIAQGIKYLESLELTCYLGSIKQTTFRILQTSDDVTAGEIINLITDLEKAFILNEEIGFLREQAFDECYIPQSYRQDEEKLSKLDFLTIDPNYQTVAQEAEQVESEFEQMINKPYMEKDVDTIRLHKTLHEAKKETSPITKQQSNKEQNSLEDPHNNIIKPTPKLINSSDIVDIDVQRDDSLEDASEFNESDSTESNVETKNEVIETKETPVQESKANSEDSMTEQSLSEILSSNSEHPEQTDIFSDNDYTEETDDLETEDEDDYMNDIEDELDFDLNTAASAPVANDDDDDDDDDDQSGIGMSEDELNELISMG